MHNFVFHNPVKVIFGKGTISKVGSEAKQLGDRALLVYGKGSIIENGTYHEITASLINNDISFREHSNVQANPLLSHIKLGITCAKEMKCQVVIAVGGGSVMDSAKAIAAGACVDHDIWKFFSGKKSVKETIPVICIPTVAGTGSEMNSGIVLTNDEKKLKFGFAHRFLFPKVCIADPTTTFTVPPKQSAFGAVDTIVHCLEAYFSTKQNNIEFQNRFMENVCKTTMETIPKVITRPNSYDDRATLLWTSSMALCGIATSGIGKISFPIHLLEHGISALFDTVPHGAGLSALLPGWMSLHHNTLLEQFARLGENIFGISEGSSQHRSLKAVKLTKDFLISINCPVSLSEIGIFENHYSAIIEHCLAQAKIWRMSDMDHETLRKILRNCQ